MSERKFVGSLVVALICGFSSPVFAQVSMSDLIAEDENYEVYRIPEPVMSEDAACYDFEQLKELFLIDNDLRLAVESAANKDAAIASLEVSTKSLVLALSESDVQLATLQADRARLTTKWTEENRLRHIAENRPTFGSWIPWVITGVAVAAFGGTATVLALD